MQPITISWACKIHQGVSKDQAFCGGLMLFIAIDRLEQASGKMFWQQFSTSALVPAQNDKRFGLWLGKGSYSFYFLAQFFKEISWRDHALALSCSVCNFWHCGPISSRFGRELEVLKAQRCCKHIASKKPQQKAVLKTSPGQLCVGSDRLQRWFRLCFCITRGA